MNFRMKRSRSSYFYKIRLLSMHLFPTFRSSLLSLLALSLGLIVSTGCKSTAKTYKDIKYDPIKLKTPPGHGMTRSEYPFDENGNYRKDWVINHTGGKDKSASPAPFSNASSTARVAANAKSDSDAAYPTYTAASAARANGSTPALSSFVGPVEAPTGTVSGEVPSVEAAESDLTSAPTPSSSGTLASVEVPAVATITPPKKASYHKVVSGDTLTALSKKYGTTVAKLKSVNGLSGDGIHVGQSLRLP